jgi:hypothetical protein
MLKNLASECLQNVQNVQNVEELVLRDNCDIISETEACPSLL